MTPKDELLASLLVERQDNTWWRYKPPSRIATKPVLPLPEETRWDDSPLTVARRIRDLMASHPKEDVA